MSTSRRGGFKQTDMFKHMTGGHLQVRHGEGGGGGEGAMVICQHREHAYIPGLPVVLYFLFCPTFLSLPIFPYIFLCLLYIFYIFSNSVQLIDLTPVKPLKSHGFHELISVRNHA